MVYGIWQITSARAKFQFKETYMNATSMEGAKNTKMQKVFGKTAMR